MKEALRADYLRPSVRVKAIALENIFCGASQNMSTGGSNNEPYDELEPYEP